MLSVAVNLLIALVEDHSGLLVECGSGVSEQVPGLAVVQLRDGVVVGAIVFAVDLGSGYNFICVDDRVTVPIVGAIMACRRALPAVGSIGTPEPIEYILRKLDALALQSPILGCSRLLERRRGRRWRRGGRSEEGACRSSANLPRAANR
jgi:hypothetical protein